MNAIQAIVLGVVQGLTEFLPISSSGHLRIVPAGRSTMIVFVADAKHRKAHLFRRLLAKQYRAVTPTIRLGPPPQRD